MSQVTVQLQQLGFSEYETKAYIALLQQHPLNGYALAKASGVPRANIYGVLQKLEERGAIVSVNTTAGVVYSPIAPEDLIRKLSTHIEAVLVAARRGLEALATPIQQTYVQNLQGGDQLLEHATELINAANERLLIALWQPEASALTEALARAQARGVEIQMLCCQACPQECGNCQGSIYRYHIMPDHQTHGLIVIQDEYEMLVGAIGEQAIAIRTRQSSLISMTVWYLRHSITLAAVLVDIGDGLENALSAKTRHLLRVIGHGDSWLEHVQRLVEGGLPTNLE